MLGSTSSCSGSGSCYASRQVSKARAKSPWLAIGEFGSLFKLEKRNRDVSQKIIIIFPEKREPKKKRGKKQEIEAPEACKGRRTEQRAGFKLSTSGGR